MDGRIKKVSLYLQAGFYALAGVNHFVHPEFYLPLIPDYLPWHSILNAGSGLMEIIGGLALIPSRTRKLAGYLLIALLVLIVPSHIHFLQMGSCLQNSLCVSPWISWLRLLAVHPLLIFWAYWHVRAAGHQGNP
jgi:uncharacterized membrane protein